jgi:hypothetical protein
MPSDVAARSKKYSKKAKKIIDSRYIVWFTQLEGAKRA